jgi:hypothetical protein
MTMKKAHDQCQGCLGGTMVSKEGNMASIISILLCLILESWLLDVLKVRPQLPSTGARSSSFMSELGWLSWGGKGGNSVCHDWVFYPLPVVTGWRAGPAVMQMERETCGLPPGFMVALAVPHTDGVRRCFTPYLQPLWNQAPSPLPAPPAIATKQCDFSCEDAFFINLWSQRFTNLLLLAASQRQPDREKPRIFPVNDLDIFEQNKWVLNRIKSNFQLLFVLPPSQAPLPRISRYWSLFCG